MDEPLQKLLFSTVVRGDFSPNWRFFARMAILTLIGWLTQVHLLSTNRPSFIALWKTVNLIWFFYVKTLKKQLTHSNLFWRNISTFMLMHFLETFHQLYCYNFLYEFVINIRCNLRIFQQLPHQMVG